LLEEAGELVAASIKFLVSQVLLRVSHCDGVRSSEHLGLKKLMETEVTRIVSLGLIACDKQFMQFC
jgi:hypothetical protein